MKKYIISYGLLAFSLLMLFQLSSITLFTIGASNDWIVIVVSIVSIAIGVAITNSALFKKADSSTPVADNELSPYDELGLTNREYEVLCLLNQGLSNKEVGEKLFIAESTVKTHVSKLLVKLDAKRRIQALKNAKELNIIS